MEEIYSLNLGDYIEIENKLPNEEKRQAKIKIHKLKKDSISNLHLDCCFYCGNSFIETKKKENGCCNSHTVPTSFLDNISENGNVNFFNSIYQSEFNSKNNGLNNAGTFKLICRKCDREIFKSYENIDNYNSKPNVKMLAQIDMKNNLKNIDKCIKNLELYKVLEEGLSIFNEVSKRKEKFEIDLSEYKEAYDYAKKVSQKPFNDYNILYFKKLNYIVPVAYQGTVALINDLRGNIINNVYSNDKKYKIKNISLCVFPLENSSVIIIFTNKKNKRYSEFFNDFKKLDLEKQLSIVNYILFSYTEEYFLSPLISKNTLDQLKELVYKTSDFYRKTENPDDKKEVFKKIREIYNYDESLKFPNLLLEKFSIENLKKENI